jgi:hypothetical protein
LVVWEEGGGRIRRHWRTRVCGFICRVVSCEILVVLCGVLVVFGGNWDGGEGVRMCLDAAARRGRNCEEECCGGFWRR